MRLHRVSLLLAATACLLALNMVPGVGALLYPIKLLVTYVHEGMHALAALLTGGHVLSIAVHPDMSGLTWTQGGSNFLITSAGYLGTMLFGALCTFALKHGAPSRAVLIAITGMVLLNVFYMGFGNMFGAVWGLILLGVLGAGLMFTTIGFFLAPLLSIQLLLGAFYDLQTLLALSGSGVSTDAQIMASMTGIPASAWALTWLGLSVIVTWKLLLTGTWESKPAS